MKNVLILKKPVRYHGFSIAIETFLCDCGYRCFYYKDGYRQKCIYTIIHNCNIRTFLIALLVSPIFLLYELWPPCRYVLSNLATGYWSHFVTPNDEFKTSPTNSLILQVPQIWQIWQDTIHSFLLSPVPPCETLCQFIHLPPPSPSNSSPLPWHTNKYF